MADVTERLDRIEQAVATTNEQLAEVKGRLDAHDKRFDQIDDRFNQIDERFTKVDARFEAMDTRFDAMDARFDAMDTRVDSLASDVHKLQILGEKNTDDIKLIAEVQSRHGEKLDEIAKALEPFKNWRDFMEQIVGNHEERITSLEKGRAEPR